VISNLDIRCDERDLALGPLQQHVRENRERVTPLDDARDRLQRLEQRFPVGLDQVHFIYLVLMMMSGKNGDKPMK